MCVCVCGWVGVGVGVGVCVCGRGRERGYSLVRKMEGERVGSGKKEGGREGRVW